MKKAVVLLALLIAGGAAKAGAEEVTGTILFEPTIGNEAYKGMYCEFDLDTKGNLVEDMYMRIPLKDKKGDTKVYSILLKYLKEGCKIIFENKELSHLDTFKNDRMYGIIVEGKTIELTQLFSKDIIEREFPYLYAKLVREGRAR
jgi:hypothetical protein